MRNSNGGKQEGGNMKHKHNYGKYVSGGVECVECGKIKKVKAHTEECNTANDHHVGTKEICICNK